MKICVLGLGYVGAVSAGLLAKEGHEVIGVDPERAKVDLINEGRSPIIEKDLGEIIAEQVKAGRLHAATVVEDAVRHTDIVFVCVGTPSQPNGGIDLRYVKRVCQQIGETLATHPGAPIIVMDLVVQMWRFLGARRKFWLLPIILVTVLIGGLLILAQGSVVAPFIYTLF